MTDESPSGPMPDVLDVLDVLDVPGVQADRREALERELMWAIALGGDRRRIEALNRMLTPAANDVPAVEGTVGGSGADESGG